VTPNVVIPQKKEKKSERKFLFDGGVLFSFVAGLDGEIFHRKKFSPSSHQLTIGWFNFPFLFQKKMKPPPVFDAKQKK
jgi:hypothetical protein